jgi:hypothetical protein
MKWFGESWAATCCKPDDHVATPTGLACQRCSKSIVATDQGFIQAFATGRPGDASVELVPWHRDCLLKNLGIHIDET